MDGVDYEKNLGHFSCTGNATPWDHATILLHARRFQLFHLEFPMAFPIFAMILARSISACEQYGNGIGMGKE